MAKMSYDNGLCISTLYLDGFNVEIIPEQKRAHKDQSANLSWFMVILIFYLIYKRDFFGSEHISAGCGN